MRVVITMGIKNHVFEKCFMAISYMYLKDTIGVYFELKKSSKELLLPFKHLIT